MYSREGIIERLKCPMIPNNIRWKYERMLSHEYYVYSILKNELCVYIGKGRCNRVLQSLENHNGDDYKILVNNIDHFKALELEKIFIKEIGLDNLENERM